MLQDHEYNFRLESLEPLNGLDADSIAARFSEHSFARRHRSKPVDGAPAERQHNNLFRSKTFVNDEPITDRLGLEQRLVEGA